MDNDNSNNKNKPPTIFNVNINEKEKDSSDVFSYEGKVPSPPIQVTHREKEIINVNGNPVTVVKDKLSASDIKEIPNVILAEFTLDEDGEYKTKAELIYRKLINQALAGNQMAIDSVLNRTIGRPVTPNLNLNGDLSANDVLALLNGEKDPEDMS